VKSNLVSVLIVSYNAERYIEKTLRSCLNQTYPDFEILVLDNNSNDRTVEIIKNLNDSRITVFEGKKNVGPYAGLNFLLDRAEGEYIAIQDHDDIWLPEKIERQVSYLEENKPVIACGTETFYFYENKGVLIADKREKFVDFVDHTSLVFRNAGFRYDPDYLLADEYFEKKIIGGKIYCIGEQLTVHRIRRDGRNYSRSRFSFSRKNVSDFFEMNGANAKSILSLFGIFVMKYFPDDAIWLIVGILKRKSTKINRADFSALVGSDVL